MVKLFQPGMGFPTNRAGAIAYVEEMADGIKLWAKIDVVIVPLAVLFLFLNFVPWVVGCMFLVAIGCPIVMVLGYYVGWSKYLTPMECYRVVKAKLST